MKKCDKLILQTSEMPVDCIKTLSKGKEKIMKNSIIQQKEVPVFFAADENYLPFLGVTLTSLIKHADVNRKYAIHVLYTGALGDNANKIMDLAKGNISLQFHDVTPQICEIQHMIHCRDYYTSAIYFRLFIPQLFPKYDKAVYLDCDTVLLTDIAKLYDIPLGGNYIGAVADPIVSATPAFAAYTKYALGIEARKYFNSGVIVMQLEKLRNINFCHLFMRVLRSYDFVVAPDQDCLNLICKDKVHYFGKEWNAMPLSNVKFGAPKLIHYNLSMKPWHYDGVLYERYFWDTAKDTPFYQTICNKKRAFSKEQAKQDEESGARLLRLAQAEAENPYNYERTVGARLRMYQKSKEVGGMYGFIEYFGGQKSAVNTD
ncbi:MAG: glycosyltransferase family 8 protein [Clostridiales bacterium]|nr:glycosyltransferase family 8 protein [Clostridiales bacterium]